MADVAQLVRASGCGSEGRGFDSRRLPQAKNINQMDIIILAIITAVIFYRLNKSLGTIDEDEKREIHKKLLERKKQIEEILERAQKSANNPATQNEKIIGSKSTSQKEFDEINSATQENLKNIFNSCNITYEFFINGAKMAFEMVINAFSKNDFDTLKILLSEKIYQGFEVAINQRQSQNHTLITNLISINKTEIISAILLEKQASITVKIISSQINYITDKNQNIINGKKDEIHETIDIWTFKKDITSTDPNWKIYSTSSN